MRLAGLFALVLLALSPAPGRAHELDPGFLDLSRLGGDTWRVFWKVPQARGQPMSLVATLPESCTPREPSGAPRFDGRSFVWQWVATCPNGIAGGEIAVRGLDATRTDVLVRFETVPGRAQTHRLTSAEIAFRVPQALGVWGVFSTYVSLGVTHILEGLDHLLFVFALLLLIRDWRTLVGAVTSFTVAHSLSLAAATLGWIVVPAPPVEAVIALSIMFLASEYLRPAPVGLRLTERFPWIVSFAFGLLHGLGFARALLDIGLPQGEVPLALLAFNVGVEIGQLLFIAAVLSTAALVKRIYPALLAAIATRGAGGGTPDRLCNRRRGGILVRVARRGLLTLLSCIGNDAMHQLISVVIALVLGVCALAPSARAAEERRTARTEPSWHSPSLTMETVTGPNGAVTTRTALAANALFGITETKVAEKVVDGVYALRGWGIASSYALEAPSGWIIVDTGDSTRAAAEMREMLERAVGRKIRVAAILLTHWHYADGTGAWLDEGAEVWGHEHLDRNRSASTGVSVKSGFYQARAVAQFGVFHPLHGPDAFPNKMGFTPEKLLVESSYQPPTRRFEDGKILDVEVAGEPVQVAPCRTDTGDSVAFYFPGRRLLVTNFMVTGAVFNVYTLRGGPFRNPAIFINDARWVESKNAEILLDIHGPTLKGEKAVRQAVERSVDQVQLIHDQTLRLIAQGLAPREAAEALYMPRALREGREAYGQVESHVRQVYNGTVGWFDGDVYDINPLSLREEATRTVKMMGGRKAVRNAAAQAAKKGGLEDWRWSLKLTSLLLRLDPGDTEAHRIRAAAARALGQRTTSANARGFYITEALQLEGKLKVEGQPMTLDAIRMFVGTPSAEQLTAASVDENLQFIRYLVDAHKAEGKRLVFTIAAEGDRQIKRVELRNSVLVISDAESKAAAHVDVTRRELADFVLGKGVPVKGGGLLAQLDGTLDRRHLLPAASRAPAGMAPTGKARYNDGLEQ